MNKFKSDVIKIQEEKEGVSISLRELTRAMPDSSINWKGKKITKNITSGSYLPQLVRE